MCVSNCTLRVIHEHPLYVIVRACDDRVKNVFLITSVSRRPVFLQLDFSCYEEAYSVHTLLKHALERDPDFPLAVSWIRSRWYYRVADKAKEMAQMAMLVSAVEGNCGEDEQVDARALADNLDATESSVETGSRGYVRVSDADQRNEVEVEIVKAV